MVDLEVRMGPCRQGSTPTRELRHWSRDKDNRIMAGQAAGQWLQARIQLVSVVDHVPFSVTSPS
jgi:hypothetical protein